MGPYIKVVTDNLGCFKVDPVTLETLTCSYFDPWAIAHPDPEAVETISVEEWYRRQFQHPHK